MMALMVKIAVLLLVVFSATALENSRGVDSISPSSEQFPSMITSEKCVALCVPTCQDKKGWKNKVCLALCITECVKEPSPSRPEIVCAADCARSSTNTLRYDSKMDDRMNACTKECKKDKTLMHE